MCPGSKPLFDVAWRDQNLVAAKSVQRRTNATKKNREIQDSAIVSINIPKVLPQDYASYAVDFFFSFYICLPKDQDVNRNVLDCLYPIWAQSSAASPLRPIVTAVAAALLDAWSAVKPDQPRSVSRSQYAQGVAALRKYLEQNDSISNEVIMAALMLDMYDNVLAFLTGRRNKAPHMGGTTALIERRRKQPHADEMSRRLILGTRSQITNRALSSTEKISPVVSTWSREMITVPKTPGFRLDELHLELADVQSSVAQLEQGSERLAFCTLERATTLDSQYSTWMTDLPVDWLPTRVAGTNCIPQSVRDAGCYHDFCDTYKSVFIANTLMSFYSARMKLHLGIIACLEHLPPDFVGKSLESEFLIVQDLADSMCASIPFHLGNRNTPGRLDDKTICFPHPDNRTVDEGHRTAAGAFGGFFLIVPLTELLSPSVVLQPGQKGWIGGQIGRIRRICGIQIS